MTEALPHIEAITGCGHEQVGSAGRKYALLAHLVEPPSALTLECGETLSGLTVAYETYGTLNAQGDNAVLVCHGYTASAHAAGINEVETPAVGWWDGLIGPGKAFDTDRYFVISSNVLGGCRGTTGPSSVNPRTGKAFGSEFPAITLGDMVTVQKLLIQSLGVTKLHCVAGGSMGGMQALEWAMRFPGLVANCIPIACGPYLTAQALALGYAQRLSVEADPNWHGGDYYGIGKPDRGLAAARILAHTTYVSREYLDSQFGGAGSPNRLAILDYLEDEARSFVNRFDANSFMVLGSAMAQYARDLSALSAEQRVGMASINWLLVSFTTDWLFPAEQLDAVAAVLREAGADVTREILATEHGHDAFLTEQHRLTPYIHDFLTR